MKARKGARLLCGLLTLTALAWPGLADASLVRPSAQRCQRYRSPGDVDARVLARESEIAAEVVGTDNHGLYTKLSPATVRALEPSIPISSRQARRAGQRAYLLSAAGTATTYVLTTRSLDGDTYTIERASSGAIERHARSCGARRRW